MIKTRQIIWIHLAAPSKPLAGRPCNGCGVCCLLAPCPLGMLLSARRRGACAVLRWIEEEQSYRCGAVTDAAVVVAAGLPRFMQGLLPRCSRLLAHLARRWIAVGTGCDCSVELVAPEGQAVVAAISSTMRHRSHFGRR